MKDRHRLIIQGYIHLLFGIALIFRAMELIPFCYLIDFLLFVIFGVGGSWFYLRGLDFVGELPSFKKAINKESLKQHPKK